MDYRTKINVLHYYWIIFFLIIPSFGIAQNTVTLVITEIPSYTPKTDTLYLSSSLDGWIESNDSKRFRHFPDGAYRLTVDLKDNSFFEYKINRGNWDKVEGNNWGDYRLNRKFVYNDSIFEIHLKVLTWQDLHHSIYPPIDIIVKSIPENTPHDASIFLTGTFNNWIDNDPNYKLSKNSDGSYSGKIPPGYDTISYKFIRGPWESIESRWDGGMLSNRTFIASSNRDRKVVTEIADWQDLSTKKVSLKAIFLLLILQSIVLIVIKLHHKSGIKLLLLNVLVILALLLKYLYLDFPFLTHFPKGYLLTGILFSTIIPIYYIKLKKSINKFKTIERVLYLPLILVLLWYLSYYSVSKDTFFLGLVTNKYNHLFFSLYGFSSVFMLILYFNIQSVTSNLELNKNQKRTYQIFQYSCYAITSITIAAVLLYISQDIDIKFVTDWYEHLVWIFIGVSLIYYHWSTILEKNSVSHKLQNSKIKDSHLNNNWMKLKSKLVNLMEEDKVYLNPELTLSDLSLLLGTNNQYVSKLINEGFEKSYNDYINSYRIKLFIDIVQNDNTNRTFLHHAFKVGFNSKSAFNRAFKKVKNTTPSEYFSSRKIHT
ncbi:helix-turn-helix domain-containing protein [Saccharicrinis aurantiacus]|uniref:helix-turn-helix domain-containing protein n=1 Tax=Saccharicrinis aurantiacus TaxID=1849719 RepID=UPI000950340B|nr:helix-turn-helix domain-containing protein [Saccharicrinis aurantiacus]